MYKMMHFAVPSKWREFYDKPITNF